MRLRPFRRATLAVTALAASTALVLAAAVPAGAATVTSSVSLSIRASACSSTYSWAGANYSASSPATLWPRGTVKFCAWKYQMLDSDPAYDYYMAYASSDYNLSQGNTNLAAPANQNITSNRTASGNVYGATKAYTGSESCTKEIAVGVSAGPFSVDVTPLLCKSYVVSRPFAGPTAAGWSAAKVGGVGEMESVFYQKVPQGVKPVFTFDFYRPTYTHTWYEAGGWYKETASSAKWTSIL